MRDFFTVLLISLLCFSLIGCDKDLENKSSIESPPVLPSESSVSSSESISDKDMNDIMSSIKEDLKNQIASDESSLLYDDFPTFDPNDEKYENYVPPSSSEYDPLEGYSVD